MMTRKSRKARVPARARKERRARKARRVKAVVDIITTSKMRNKLLRALPQKLTKVPPCKCSLSHLLKRRTRSQLVQWMHNQQLVALMM